MRKVLLVISRFDAGASARQLALLAASLSPERFEIRVCVLGCAHRVAVIGDVPGVSFAYLDWVRALDARPLRALRAGLRQFGPDIIHAFDLQALRAVCLSKIRIRDQTAAKSSRCLLYSGFAPNSRVRASATWANRWLLRRAQRIVAWGRSDGIRYRHLVPEIPVEIINPATVSSSAPIVRCAAPGQRLLACCAPQEEVQQLRTAVWTFDILKCVDKDLHLAVIGDGPDRARLDRFIEALVVRHGVSLVPATPDWMQIIASCGILLAPSDTPEAVQAALDAMMVGRPVVGVQSPRLAEIVLEGETGYLVPPGDPAALARAVRRLLMDRGLAIRLGEAGRRRAQSEFGGQAMVSRFARVYEELATCAQSLAS